MAEFKKRLVSEIGAEKRDHLFEDLVQNKNEIIKSLVLCSYNYYPQRDILCVDVQRFLDWFKGSTYETNLKTVLNTRKNEDIRSYKNMIKVLFVCHGNIQTVLYRG